MPTPCGRGDEAYTGNRSAFDVFVDYDGPLGRSFLGIEVKYHEDLSGNAAKDENGRYVALADKHRIFRQDLVPALQKPPLQQIWLDHLLALQLRSNPKDDGWKAGTFALLYPVGNTACADGAARYRRCLTDAETFDARTLDDVVQAARLNESSLMAGRCVRPLSRSGPGQRHDRRSRRRIIGSSVAAYFPPCTTRSRRPYPAPSSRPYRGHVFLSSPEAGSSTSGVTLRRLAGL